MPIPETASYSCSLASSSVIPSLLQKYGQSVFEDFHHSLLVYASKIMRDASFSRSFHRYYVDSPSIDKEVVVMAAQKGFLLESIISNTED